MKTRKLEISELVDALREQNLMKRDMVVPAKNLLFRNGKLVITNPTGSESFQQMLEGTGISSTNELELSVMDHCHTLISTKLGIPKSYYDRMNCEGNIPLLDTNVNHWLAEKPANYFVRTFIDETENTGFARALLSDRYNVIDNYDVLFAALDAIRQSGLNVKIDTADITEKKMYVRFICPEIEVQAPELLKNYRVPGGSPNNGNTGIISGFVITNSEVGAGQFSISPRAVILACENGMIFKDDAFSKVHLGAKMQEYSSIVWSEETKQKNYNLIISQVKDAVKTFINPEYLGQRVNKLIEQGSKPLENPTDAVKNVCKMNTISEEKEKDILSYFIQGGDTTAFGVSQAITYYAHKNANADDQYDLELCASEILTDTKAFDRPYTNPRKKVAAQLN